MTSPESRSSRREEALTDLGFMIYDLRFEVTQTRRERRLLCRALERRSVERRSVERRSVEPADCMTLLRFTLRRFTLRRSYHHQGGRIGGGT